MGELIEFPNINRICARNLIQVLRDRGGSTDVSDLLRFLDEGTEFFKVLAEARKLLEPACLTIQLAEINGSLLDPHTRWALAKV